MMELSIWTTLSVVFKFFLYLSVSIAVGSGFIKNLTSEDEKLQKSIERYWGLAIWGGVWVALSYFLVQVGAFVEGGFVGMFNMEYADMLWQSSIGDALNYQVIGFFLVWISKIVYQLLDDLDSELKNQYFSIPVFIIGVLFLSRSLSVVGHTAEHGWIFQLILSLHFICIAWWVGALFPLRSACQLLKVQSLFKLMENFGKLASVVVALLILSGAILVALFAKGSLDIFTTNYGLILLGKFVLVGSILLIALYHKIKLVPALESKNNAHIVLKHSITREIVIAMLILLVTALLTTVVGTTT